MTRPDDAAALLPAEFIRPVISLRQLWVMVWAWRKWIAIFVAVVVVGTAVASKVLPKTYEGTTTLLMAFQVDDPLSGREFSSLLAESYMATQMEFIQSPTTLMGVVDKLKLADNSDYTAGYFGNGTPDSLRDWAMQKLALKISVKQGKDSRFIYINAADHDPVMAATLANSMADSYVEEQIRQVAEPAKQRAEKYGEQLEGLKQKVDEAQSAVTAFRTKAGLISLDETGIDSSRIADLDHRLAEARGRRESAELRLNGIGEGDASVLGSNLIQNLKNQLTQKEAEMATLRGSLGTRHPQYIALQSEIDRTREQLNREISVYGQGAHAEATAARSLEQKLEREMSDTRSKALDSRSMQEEGARLGRELETATKIYQGALDNYDKILQATAVPVNDATIVTRATPPIHHVRPLAGLNTAIALVLSSMLSVGGALFVELLHRRVRCREDLERDLRIPVLAELRSSKA